MNKSHVLLLRERVMHCGCLRLPSLTAQRASRARLGSKGLNKTCLVAESDCFQCNIDLIEPGDVIYW